MNRRFAILLLLLGACKEPHAPPIPDSDRHCVNEMIEMYTRRGSPDSVMVEAWRTDSTLPHRYYEGWWYPGSIEGFSWGAGAVCDRVTTPR